MQPSDDPLVTEVGVFVAFEGGEGSGKSTQSRLLASWVESRGHTALLTREPGGTEVGARLRSILLDPATGDLSPRTEALIYAADKAEHVDTMILPALADGSVVITDRYVDSTLAYQGAGRALHVGELEPLARWATADLRPHLTVVLDVDPRVGLARAGEPDRIEGEPIEFHDRVRRHFLDLADADPEHYVVLDADEAPEAIHERVRAALLPWLPQARGAQA
ncbi:dTMP kinase [Aeromicrobium tamlense]|uniref:Thymidylate kinase n=1 Tax=Aeromicrobium tamlense TaxID=375541 RepID=A0A8I0FV93_9ACTN|nr:dTMP kinase [Aeromicrobium tamlense]MBD1269566.1 dTMP kinase [Aeromicrobium tamlense]NYI39780.1 dTMP kinase [Aeromicrobium tamlense]